MTRIFTEYFRALDPRSGAPPPDLFDHLWRALRTALKREIQYRGLWDGPPRFLGVADEDESWTSQALEELTIDCYSFILARLRGLKQQLRVKPNIDGLILLNIRHFLHDRQKRYDPLGFRIFESVRKAVRQAVDEGRLEVLGGDLDIGNSTRLAIALNRERQASPEVDVSREIRSLSGELILRLLTAKGKRRDKAVAQLSEHVSALFDSGIDSLRFKELVDAVKATVRERWQAIWLKEQGDTAFEDAHETFCSVVPIVNPETLYEDRESFQKLVACVSSELDHLDTEAKTHGYLTTLWNFLRTKAPDPRSDALPSRRRTAEHLGIPRDRLPGLYAILGQLVEGCRKKHSGQVEVDAEGGQRRVVSERSSR